MTIYLDNEYKCHTTDPDGAYREITLPSGEVETPFFEGKCAAFIEGYRYVPQGEAWTRADGRVFYGEMCVPFKDFSILRAYQDQYEAMLPEMADMQNALNLLGVSAGD